MPTFSDRLKGHGTPEENVARVRCLFTTPKNLMMLSLSARINHSVYFQKEIRYHQRKGTGERGKQKKEKIIFLSSKTWFFKRKTPNLLRAKLLAD